MGIYKRGSTWWIDFATPRGERVRRSAQTNHRQAAQELHDQLKAQDDLHLSPNEVAIAVLQRQRAAHRERVFTYHGKPVNQVNTKAWRAALRRAGIDNFRWHDLRHTWVSWVVQHGTPLYDLQEMGGWKSSTMVRRYAHLAPAQMARHAAVVGRSAGRRRVHVRAP